jgi:hypothetical protein
LILARLVESSSTAFSFRIFTKFDLH